MYEAFDEALAEPLALKTLRAQVASQAVTVERFRREIQLARKVTHRNVCRTYDLGRHEMPDGNVVTFLTMELLRGTSLDRYMRGRGRLTTDEALPFVLQMTAGLEAAHTAGVIHRDFKPGNLVLVPEAGAGPDDPQRLVISDFGLARRHGLGEETITSTGESLGTPLYMAPEQVHSGIEPITPATDLYALGIVMYELVTDDMPFKGNSTTVMALKRLRERPVSPREVAAGSGSALGSGDHEAPRARPRQALPDRRRGGGRADRRRSHRPRRRRADRPLRRLLQPQAQGVAAAQSAHRRCEQSAVAA